MSDKNCIFDIKEVKKIDGNNLDDELVEESTLPVSTRVELYVQYWVGESFQDNDRKTEACGALTMSQIMRHAALMKKAGRVPTIRICLFHPNGHEFLLFLGRFQAWKQQILTVGTLETLQVEAIDNELYNTDGDWDCEQYGQCAAWKLYFPKRGARKWCLKYSFHYFVDWKDDLRSLMKPKLSQFNCNKKLL